MRVAVAEPGAFVTGIVTANVAPCETVTEEKTRAPTVRFTWGVVTLIEPTPRVSKRRDSVSSTPSLKVPAARSTVAVGGAVTRNVKLTELPGVIDVGSPGRVVA